jgi:hypothetical protein
VLSTPLLSSLTHYFRTSRLDYQQAAMADKNPISGLTPQQEKEKRESWGEWSGRHYNQQYENWG